MGGSGERTQLGRYAWTDLTYLLHAHHVSWAYYVQSGVQPDCDARPGPERRWLPACRHGARTPSIWNPLPSFTDVKADGQLTNIKNLSAFYPAAAHGHLPAVTWIMPAQPNTTTLRRASRPARPT